MDVANIIGDIVEAEGLHPDLYIYYRRIVVQLCTLAICGISKNNNIVTSKHDAILHCALTGKVVSSIKPAKCNLYEITNSKPFHS